MSDFEDGKLASKSGKTLSDNPFICGKTKLGADKFSDFDRGCEWQNGFKSTAGRLATKAELETAATVDVTRFRRKSNRYYQGR